MTDPSESSIKRLLDFEVDGALVAGDINRDLLEAEKTFDEELVLVAPSGVTDIGQLKNRTIRLFLSSATGKLAA